MARKPQVVADAEVLPEADRLEDFPHPRETHQLFGHDDGERAFAHDFSAGRLHHGWLICGPRGIGKATLAYRIARFMLADEGERAGDGLAVTETGTAFRQVLSLAHPRLMLIRRPYDLRAKRFSASIPVDEVRRIKTFLAHTAGPGAWRVVIVDQADELNIAAANALLKALEEPPPQTVFLLISSEPGRLLPTIRSRCRRLELVPLGEEDLCSAVGQAMEAVGQDMPTRETWQQLVGISKGSVRRALQLAQSDGVALQARVIGWLGALPSVDWASVHGVADDLTGAGNEQRFEIFFELLLDTLAEMVRARVGGAAMRVSGIDCARVIDETRLANWAEVWERVVARKVEAQVLNLDRRALIVETLTRLQAMARH